MSAAALSGVEVLRAATVRLRLLPLLPALLVLALAPGARAQDDVGPPLQDDIRAVHDPVMMRQGDTWYLFSTGSGIPIRCSEDLQAWRPCGQVYFKWPAWFRQEVLGVRDLWAPDISYFAGSYHLYYALSTFGSNRSVIALATSPTLDPSAEDYGWTDRGKVIESHESDDYNAIDPNVAFDADGHAWLAFGSFWGGIQLRRIDTQTGMPSAEDATLYNVARRPAPPHAIEAPFLVYRAPYYYLFVSFDFCCRAADSTYNIRVGRAEAITGPYLDRDGVPMLEGGGTLLVTGTDRWRGPGHEAVVPTDAGDLLIYHAYDAEVGGWPTLRIRPLHWADGWPSVTGPGAP